MEFLILLIDLMALINFYIPKSLKYVILATFFDYTRNIIFDNNFKDLNIIDINIITFISLIPAVLLYLYEKNIEKKLKEINDNYDYNDIRKQKVFLIENKEDNIKKKEKKTIIKFFFLGYCIFIFFINSLNYDYFYSFEMKKNYFEINIFFLFILYFLTEGYLLNFNYYRHHYIGIGLNVIPLILDLYLINIDFKIIPFILVFLFQIILITIEVFFLTMIKKLNNDYFINMNFILFIQGVSGLILTFIYYFLFKNYFNFSFPKFELKLLIIIICYCILNCFYNILFLKIIEETRPSYILILNQTYDIINIIVKLIFNDFEEIKIIEIISLIFFIPSFSLYFEIITLNFLELDKYTKNKIDKRGDSEDIEFNLYNTNIIKASFISFINIEKF